MTALDVLKYLQTIQSQGNDLAKMKFTIDHIEGGSIVTTEPTLEHFYTDIDVLLIDIAEFA